MPYRTVADLPEAQTDQYSAHQKDAFLKAFNNAYDEYGGDESRAFAVAHAAAKRAGEKPGARIATGRERKRPAPAGGATAGFLR